MKHTLLAAVVALTLAAFQPSSAQAAFVPYFSFGADTHMTSLEVGQTGIVVSDLGMMAPLVPEGNDYALGRYFGELPSMSKITFTYHMIFSPVAACSLAECGGNLNATSRVFMSGHFGDDQLNELYGRVYHSNHYNGGTYDLPVGDGSGLMLSAMSYFPDDKTAVVQLVNQASIAAFFSTSLVTGGAGWGLAFYQVDAVPLPAALPLFGLGLAGLVGYRRLKNKNKAI